MSEFLSHMKDKLSPTEYNHLSQAVNETPQNAIRLPSLRKLKIANLNLFSKDFDLVLGDGLNIIYGGNRNGKTTVANSIEFGIFGIFQHTHSYFASRILNPGKPVKIEVEVRLGSSSATIRREISQASASHKARLTFFGEPLFDKGPSIEGPTDVQLELQQKIGCAIQEAHEVFDAFYLREVPRNYHLSSRIGDDIGSEVRRRILYRLIDSDRFNRIIAYCKSKCDELHRSISLDSTELAQINSESDNQRAGRIEKIRADLKYIDEQFSKLSELKKIIFEDMNGLLRASKPDNDLMETQFELAGITSAVTTKAQGYERLKSATNIGAEKVTCETCGQDYTQEAYERTSNNKCMTCGSSISQEQLVQIAADLDDLRKREQSVKRKSDLKFSEIEQSTNQVQELQKKLDSVVSEMENLSSSKTELQSELLRATNAVGKERIDQLIASIEEEKEREAIWNKVFTKTLEYASKNSSNVIKELNKRFLAYTSDIVEGSDGFAFDNSLNLVDRSGRSVSFEHLSHGEKNLLEIAYRLSLIEIALQKKTIEEGFLILETPEEALDITYRDNLAKIFSSVKESKLKLIVTTSDRDSIMKLKPSISTVTDLVKMSTFVSKQQEKQLRLTEF
jgi:DNA repair exonuclease SbcCD ATPase subunit